MLNIATLDTNNICVSIKSVKAGYTLAENEKLVDSYDPKLLRKTYNPETGEFYLGQSAIEDEAKQWRDSELYRTDSLILLPDYPYKEQLLSYRQALRDWPNTTDFPNTRPEMAGV